MKWNSFHEREVVPRPRSTVYFPSSINSSKRELSPCPTCSPSKLHHQVGLSSSLCHAF
jgi:hypothetical protein